MSDKRRHGGRRANQTGRPPLPEKKIRIGTLFLIPATVKHLVELAHDGETLIQTAARILAVHLSEDT